MDHITPFTLVVGDRSHPKIGVVGTYRWGAGGWLVTDGMSSYQAPGESSFAEAILEWLRRRLA